MPQSIRWLVMLGLLVFAKAATAQPAPQKGAAVLQQPAPNAAPDGTAPSGPSGGLPPAAPAAPEESAEESPRVQARAAYDRGQAAFGKGDFEQALAAFETAYGLLPNPIVLRSIAKSEERLGRIVDAISHLSAFLRALPDHPERAQIEREISELRRRPGTLVFVVTPVDALIQVDDRPAALRSRAAIQLSPGPHLVTVTRTGHERVLREIQVVPGARQELRVDLSPVQADLADEVLIADGQDDTALWVAGGIGVVGLSAGTVLGFLALSENSDFDADPTVESADRGERLALFADVAFGVAAMAAVTAAVLYLTAEEPEPAPTAALQWGLAPVPGGAVGSASLRY